jgi:hypothetical protein
MEKNTIFTLILVPPFTQLDAAVIAARKPPSYMNPPIAIKSFNSKTESIAALRSALDADQHRKRTCCSPLYAEGR